MAHFSTHELNNSKILFGKFGWFNGIFKIPIKRSIENFPQMELKFAFFRSICYAKWLHKIQSFIPIWCLICHVYSIPYHTCIFLYIFCILTKHLFHRDKRPFIRSSEFVCVLALLLCRACSVLHRTWTENWFELVQFNWLTIIYASCKHNSTESMELSCSQSVIGSICRVVNFPRTDVIYKWHNTINTSQRTCTNIQINSDKIPKTKISK